VDDARQARELDAQREQCAREQLLADIQLQRDREAQREIDLRRDLYDLSRQCSRAAALDAELKCLKATAGPPTVAYDVVEVPVQSDDIAPPEVNTVVQISPSRSVTPVDNLVVQGLPANLTQRRPPVSAAIVHRPDAADALTWHPHAADTSTVYSCHGTSTSTLQPSFLPSAMHESTVYRSGPEYTQPQQFYAPPVVASDPVYTHYQSDTQPRLHTQPRMPAATAIAEQAYTHMPAHTFPRLLEPACTQSTVTSALPRQPTAPGDFAFIDDTMQRVASVLIVVMCTHIALNNCLQSYLRRRMYVDIRYCRCCLNVHRLRHIYTKTRTLLRHCQRTGTQIRRFM